MFSSKKVSAIDTIPSTWVLEYYLKLTVKLIGQTYKIKSIFNLKDKDPSMALYIPYGETEYKYKCFSTGKHGSAYELVMHMFHLQYLEAVNKINADYHEYVLSNGALKHTTYSPQRWEVVDYKVRSWNKLDVDYWSPYNIGSELLSEYNVKALSEYTMHKEDSPPFVKTGSMVYGYFTATGKLYKIYQPANLSMKFMTLLPNYLQGYDQIVGKDRLFICSSLKDIMSLRSLKIPGDYIAPQSENTGIESIIHWINTYPEKYTIFDNDSTGLRTMEKYKTMYQLPYLHVQLSKDISDSIRDHGAKAVKEVLKSLLS